MNFVRVYATEAKATDAIAKLQELYADALAPENTVLKAVAQKTDIGEVWIVVVEGRIPASTTSEMGRVLAFAGL